MLLCLAVDSLSSKSQSKSIPHMAALGLTLSSFREDLWRDHFDYFYRGTHISIFSAMPKRGGR